MKYLIAFGMIFGMVGCSQQPTPTGFAGPESSQQESKKEKERISIGNGGEDIPFDADSAWFLGPQMRTACIEHSSDFPVLPEQARTATSGDIAHWVEYMQVKRVEKELKNIPELRRLSLKLEILTECTENVDLRFKYGVVDKDVVRDRVQFRHGASTFSARDPETGRGYVFIDSGIINSLPPELRLAGFQSLLRHELGHVLGCGHVPDTIMDEAIAMKIPSESSLPLTIDGPTHELFVCKTCPTEFVQELDVNDPLMKIISPLSQLDVSQLRFVAKEGITGSSYIDLESIDGQMRNRFDIHGIQLLSSPPSGDPIFKHAWSEGGSNKVEEAYSEQLHYAGVLSTPFHNSINIYRNIAPNKEKGPMVFSILLYMKSGVNTLFDLTTL